MQKQINKQNFNHFSVYLFLLFFFLTHKDKYQKKEIRKLFFFALVFHTHTKKIHSKGYIHTNNNISLNLKLRFFRNDHLFLF